MNTDQLRSDVIEGIDEMLSRLALRPFLGKERTAKLRAMKQFWTTAPQDQVDRLLSLYKAEQSRTAEGAD